MSHKYGTKLNHLGDVIISKINWTLTKHHRIFHTTRFGLFYICCPVYNVPLHQLHLTFITPPSLHIVSFVPFKNEKHMQHVLNLETHLDYHFLNGVQISASVIYINLMAYLFLFSSNKQLHSLVATNNDLLCPMCPLEWKSFLCVFNLPFI